MKKLQFSQIGIPVDKTKATEESGYHKGVTVYLKDSLYTRKNSLRYHPVQQHSTKPKNAGRHSD